MWRRLHARVSRAAGRSIRRLACAYFGHEYIIERTRAGIYLHCLNCQTRTAGWSVYYSPNMKRHGR